VEAALITTLTALTQGAAGEAGRQAWSAPAEMVHRALGNKPSALAAIHLRAQVHGRCGHHGQAVMTRCTPAELPDRLGEAEAAR
jgi:hypothetical protein